MKLLCVLLQTSKALNECYQDSPGSSSSFKNLRCWTWYCCRHAISSPADTAISYKHLETGMTLLIWPWPLKMAGEDLSLGSQSPIYSSRIPLRTLWNREDIIDVPLACGDKVLIKLTRSSWQPPWKNVIIEHVVICVLTCRKSDAFQWPDHINVILLGWVKI